LLVREAEDKGFGAVAELPKTEKQETVDQIKDDNPEHYEDHRQEIEKTPTNSKADIKPKKFDEDAPKDEKTKRIEDRNNDLDFIKLLNKVDPDTKGPKAVEESNAAYDPQANRYEAPEEKDNKDA
jgi:hypothetical protein